MRNEFYVELRRFIESNRAKVGYNGNLFAYEIGEDEAYDHSLVSLRAYQTRIHSDVVRLACGSSFSFEKLPLGIVLLPKLSTIVKLQKQYGVTNA